MSKRNNMLSMSELANKKAKSDKDANAQSGRTTNQKHHNPFMSQPIINPQGALCQFLLTARADARKLLTKKGESLPVSKPFVEIEARIGTIKSPLGLQDMRILPSGPKTMPIKGKQTVVNAFLINTFSGQQTNFNGATFFGGITRSHFTKWTGAGLAEPSPITHAFGIKGNSEEIKMNVKQGSLKETEMVETVYGGYPKQQRLCFPGEHPLSSSALRRLHNQKQKHPRGKMETKEKMTNMDIALPSAPYDLRMTLATETVSDPNVLEPPSGYTVKRLKRRRSYTFKSFAWQLDITEVSNADDSQNAHSTSFEVSSGDGSDGVSYELEFELSATQTLKLINAPDGDATNKMCWTLAQQLWYMLGQINALSDILEVDEYIQSHPDNHAIKLALAQCGSLKSFMSSKNWQPAIHPDPERQQHLTPKSQPNLKFIGCMPVNFSRHNIEEVQRAEGGYFLSEKTDGVRYLMAFTGKSVVLVDRAMKGNQPVLLNKSSSGVEPFAHILSLIQPGTVLDGEVVINRKFRRPVFIVFDVLCSGKEPILHLNFAERLKHLRHASFRTKTANRDMFASTSDLKNMDIALPLVRKNFVQRMELDDLLSHVVEERGMRSYNNGEFHNHLTDGIIFQPNRPYSIGTDVHLLKWKYLDTVTIDVEILPQFDSGNGHFNNQQSLRVGVLGEEGTMVDMSRFVHLPKSELLRLEADRNETKAKIAEVGFNPETGEWYYLTMRPDKIASNHISTVLGTLLELAESLGVNELRYRMSVRSGSRDTYRKDVRRMMKQLLDHQRQSNSSGR